MSYTVYVLYFFSKPSLFNNPSPFKSKMNQITPSQTRLLFRQTTLEKNTRF